MGPMTEHLYGHSLYILWFLWLQLNYFGWLAPAGSFNISHAMSSMSSGKSMVINFEWQRIWTVYNFFRSMFLTSVAFMVIIKWEFGFAYLAHVWWVLLGQAIACCVVEQTTLFWHSHFLALVLCDSLSFFFLFKFGAEMGASDAAPEPGSTSIIYIFFNLHFSAICCVAFQFQTTTTNIVLLY